MELELAMPNLVNFFSRGVVRVRFCAWCHVFMGSFSLRASSLVQCAPAPHQRACSLVWSPSLS